jgi:hypothetical protein
LTLEKANRTLEQDALTLKVEIGALRKELRSTRGIIIESATYGSKAKPPCDAIEYFKFQCKSVAPCEPVVSNDMCGDPDPGAEKKATIRFVCDNGNTKELNVKSGGKAFMNCD